MYPYMIFGDVWGPIVVIVSARKEGYNNFTCEVWVW